MTVKMFPEEAFKVAASHCGSIVVKIIHDLLELLLVILSELYLHECDCDILLIHRGVQTSTLCCDSSRGPDYLPNLIFLEHTLTTVSWAVRIMSRYTL